MLFHIMYFYPDLVQPIQVGDRVRVKTGVTKPKYKWGQVTHQSVGIVKGKRSVCM